MRKRVALLLVLVFLTAAFFTTVTPASWATTNSWTSREPMQMARAGLGVAVVNGKIYAIGGMNASSRPPVDTNEEYDPSADTWVFKSAMPTARTSFGIAVYQNKVYCIGGKAYEDSFFVTGANEVYDPVADSWETLASMPAPRYGVEASVVDGKIYVVGGGSNATDMYDPETDSWITKAPLPVTPYLYSGWSCASAVVDGKIYVIGLGYDSSGSVAFHEIYDAERDCWSSGAEWPSGATYSSAGATTGMNAPKRIYVFGVKDIEWTFGIPEVTNLVYNLRNDRWSFGASMPTGRINAGVAVVDDRLYVIGGWIPSIGSNVRASAVNEQYTPFEYGMLDSSYDGTAPEITVTSPANITYYTADAGLNSTNIALEFTADEPVFSVHYTLDDGVPVEISGNTTITELVVGMHNVTVIGFDASGNMGASETVFFTIAEPEPFPTILVLAASGALVATIATGLLFYFKKRKR